MFTIFAFASAVAIGCLVAWPLGAAVSLLGEDSPAFWILATLLVSLAVVVNGVVVWCLARACTRFDGAYLMLAFLGGMIAAGSNALLATFLYRCRNG
ncbi:Hypothetical protein UVM_LOCUS472 [uncultured virus]|nr:Hypothetical protein UVM_LOCUS472 [uncultured virus]